MLLVFSSLNIHEAAVFKRSCFRLENASTALQIALRIQPNHIIGHANMSGICFAQGKYTCAEEHAIIASRYQYQYQPSVIEEYSHWMNL